MGKFGIYFDNFTTAASIKTAAALHADGTGEEGEIVYATIAGSGVTNPGQDIQHTGRLVRSTNGTPGTGTSQTPEKFHGASGAGLLAAVVEFSAEPGALASVYPFLTGFNQRGGIQWGVPRGEGVFVRNADTNLRALLQVISGTAGAVDGCLHYWEP